MCALDPVAVGVTDQKHLNSVVFCWLDTQIKVGLVLRSMEDRKGRSYPVLLGLGEEKPEDQVALSSPRGYLSWMEFVYI